MAACRISEVYPERAGLLVFLAQHGCRHMLGRVHSFETFGTLDGPGTFCPVLQGCMFRCLCHNQDTWPVDEGTTLFG